MHNQFKGVRNEKLKTSTADSNYGSDVNSVKIYEQQEVKSLKGGRG
jgi:hypothetical protein